MFGTRFFFFPAGAPASPGENLGLIFVLYMVLRKAKGEEMEIKDGKGGPYW